MLCPSLWQYGALPAGSSWQLQERSLPGGNSEVLRQVWSSYYLDYVCLICCFQLHVLNGWIKSGLWNWSLLGISVGWRTGTCHFQCRYLKLENGRGADFCTSYHLGLLQLNNWEHWNIELEAQLRTYEHWYSNLWTWVLKSKKGSALWMPKEY